MRACIFLAPPAAGKGTYSNYLIKKYGYQQFSTGDILRKRAENDKGLERVLASGKFVDDETIIEILSDELQKLSDDTPFILDGVPRTLHQAQILSQMLEGKDYQVIYLDIEEETLKKRVVGRRICPKCHRSYNVLFDGFRPKVENICDDCGTSLETRKDDNLESFQIRLDEFMKNTYPLKEYYESLGKLYVLDTNLSKEESLHELGEILK